MLLTTLVASCGLETYETVPSPAVSSYRNTDPLRLVLNHDPARFSLLNFQGYEVYYKVYPLDTSYSYTNLSADTSSLQTAPTVDGLKKLGYQRLNGDLTVSSPPPLLSLNTLATAATVTLDFSGSTPQLQLSTSSTGLSVYRSLTSGTSGLTTYAEFSALHKATTPIPADYDKKVTTSTSSLEVDVFLVAVALSSDIVTLTSAPVAWGVIQPFAVNQ